MAGARNEISGGIFFSAVVQGRNIVIELPQQVTPALQGLPAASSVFVGRQGHLTELLEQLAPPRAGGGEASAGLAPAAGRPQTVVVTAVGGLAGIGKTELAVQAARRAGTRGWFPGGALFVDMFGYDEARRLEPAQAIEGFLHALGVPADHIPPALQDRARLYHSILARYAQEGRRILVVIDNVSSVAQVRDLLPTDGRTGAIVTSRHTLAMLDARLLDLDILGMDDAVHLLDRVLRLARPGDTRVTDQPADAQRIARLCGGLPLALRLIAALLADRPAQPLAQLATELSVERERLAVLNYEDAGVQAAFELSYRHLAPEHARLFRLMSLNPGPDVSSRAVAVLAGAGQRAVAHGLAALRRAHLLDPSPVYERWRMHDLVRAYGNGLAEQDVERRGVLEALYGWYTHCVDVADQAMRPGRVRPDLGPYRGAELVAFDDRNAALEWCGVEQANLVAVVQAGAAEDLGHLVWSIPLSMWGFLTQNLSWDLWVDAHLEAAAAAERCGARSGQGWLLNNLATGYRVLDRREEAQEAFAAGLRVRRELGDLHGQADSLKDMAMAARVWQDWEEALRLSYQALEILRILPVPDRSGTASTLDTIGVCLAHLDRLEEAAGAGAQALAIWADLDGTRDDRAWARCKVVLGDIARRRGDAGQATTDLLAALEVFEGIHDDWGRADALRRLGAVCAAGGRVEAALGYLRQALDGFQKLGDQDAAAQLVQEIRELEADG
ncbi:tetratricopeptide repeat protein [Kitasatospora mediocidica]|uniref:tetratricopeptide repeat protein n=1 Tax=Kitasatospora mediocidica TaxID=58352 RepID=UPI00068F98E6|nr:tetratricopeptide repeat protein [Kitasatospora mediocidica]